MTESLDGVPIWVLALGVLIGQSDGKVFIPRSVLESIQRMRLTIEESTDLGKDGYYLWISPDPKNNGVNHDRSDGTST